MISPPDYHKFHNLQCKKDKKNPLLSTSGGFFRKVNGYIYLAIQVEERNCRGSCSLISFSVLVKLLSISAVSIFSFSSFIIWLKTASVSILANSAERRFSSFTKSLIFI